MTDLEYLPLVVEEAAEVIQAAMKLTRFGHDHRYREGEHKGRTNVEALAREVGDLLEVIACLKLPEHWVHAGRVQKAGRLAIYGPGVWYPGIEDDLPFRHPITGELGKRKH